MEKKIILSRTESYGNKALMKKHHRSSTLKKKVTESEHYGNKFPETEHNEEKHRKKRTWKKKLAEIEHSYPFNIYSFQLSIQHFKVILVYYWASCCFLPLVLFPTSNPFCDSLVPKYKKISLIRIRQVSLVRIKISLIRKWILKLLISMQKKTRLSIWPKKKKTSSQKQILFRNIFALKYSRRSALLFFFYMCKYTSYMKYHSTSINLIWISLHIFPLT